MLHTLLSKKVFLLGLLLCVFCVVGSLVYHQTVRRDVREQEAKTQQFLRQLETRKANRLVQRTETYSAEDLGQEKSHFVSDNVSEITSESAEVLPTDDLDFIEIGEDLFAGETSATHDEVVSPYGVSPYGFGPYPEIPVGFPEHLMPVWTWSEKKLERIAGRGKNFELMHRVLIKLWNQGDQDFIGVSLNDQSGKVYPTYQNVMYVTDWAERENGTVRLPASFFGAAEEDFHIMDIIKDERVPAMITFLDANTHGYDPYQFLDLQ